MEMPRDQTLCQFAIEKTEPLIINDMTIDYRFKNHPAVVDFGVKFTREEFKIRIKPEHRNIETYKKSFI